MNQADPRVKRTRKLLTDALLALLGEERFADISVQDIAERATVNRATFYAHYADKHALLDAAVADIFGGRLRAALPDGAPFTAGNLRALVVATLDAMADFYGYCRPAHRDLIQVVEQRHQRLLQEHLLGWLGAVPARRGARVTPHTAAALASWAVFGAGVEYGRGGDREAAVARADEVLAVVLHGVGAAVDVAAPAAS